MPLRNRFDGLPISEPARSWCRRREACYPPLRSWSATVADHEFLNPLRERYLGHVVGRNGVATNPEKVQAVEDWVTPQDLTGLRAFLGLVGYYRQYIPDF